VAGALADAGHSIDELTAAEAIELADTLRAIVAALPAPTTRDMRLTVTLNAAAGIRRAARWHRLSGGCRSRSRPRNQPSFAKTL
jgi:hypothetical protein